MERLRELSKNRKYEFNTITSCKCSLEGLFSYEEVEKINNATKYIVKYGICIGIGPIAIVGLPKKVSKIKYFKDIWEYGKKRPTTIYDFEEISKCKAKKMNYKVYVFFSKDNLKGYKIEKVNMQYDSRYIKKQNPHITTLCMDCLLHGLYSYEEAKNLAACKDFSSQSNEITFARLDDGRIIGIIGIWYSEYGITLFKDVWEYGKPEPRIQAISFIPEEEAISQKRISIYIYNLCLPEHFSKENMLWKVDRTFNPNWNFYNLNLKMDSRLIN